MTEQLQEQAAEPDEEPSPEAAQGFLARMYQGQAERGYSPPRRVRQPPPRRRPAR